MANIEYSIRTWSTNLVLLIILLGFHFQFSDAFTDTILQGQSISTSQTIVSAAGNFELGFFRPGNSTNYYLGIWYGKVSEQTVVWVANRDYSFKNPSVVFTVNADGNLEILEGKVSYQVTSISSNRNTTATLLDSGNLVLRNDNLSILWQSFDYPSHTFLPGMNIGFDRKAGKTWSLTSWKSLEDPTPGDFSLEVDPNGTSQFFIMRGSRNYWTSGLWNGNSHIFSLVPEMRLNYIFNYSYSSSKDHSYFTYSLYDSSIISRSLLDVSGQLKQLTWLEVNHEWNLFWTQPRRRCDGIAYCGPFGICNDYSYGFLCDCLPEFEPASSHNWNLGDVSGGCTRKVDLHCGNTTHAKGEKDQFRRVSNVRLPEGSLTFPSRSDKDCKSTCLNNCSCSAYAYNREKCTVWVGDIVNVQQLSDGESVGQYFDLKFAASELNRRGNKIREWL